MNRLLSTHPVPRRERLIVALDFPRAADAKAFVERLGEAACFYKVGLELFTSGGAFELLDWLVQRGHKVFADLKLYDIPETVRRAVANLRGRGITFVTVHGDRAIMEAAAKEKPGLVDPYSTNPDALFKWVADDVLKEVEIRAASNKVAAKRAFAAAEQFYGLNREELKRWRWKTYADFLVLKDSLLAFEAAGIEPALRQRIRDQITAMTTPAAPYAGMVRYFVGAFGLAL